MNKHTPYPWILADGDGGGEESRYITNTSDIPVMIADCWPDVSDDYDLPQTYEYQANAKILVMAPEMLNELRHIAEITEQGLPLRRDHDLPRVQKLIARALGEDA